MSNDTPGRLILEVVHRILIRAINWVGDAVMSLPAIRAVRERFPAAHIAVLARPRVPDLYAREPAIDRVLRDVGLTGVVIGGSPGAAYGNAKRWLRDRLAETAVRLGNQIALFGSAGDRALCDTVGILASDSGARVYNFAGETTLAQFIELA